MTIYNVIINEFKPSNMHIFVMPREKKEMLELLEKLISTNTYEISIKRIKL